MAIGKIATCYELREIWGYGCPFLACALANEPAKPSPCVHRASNVIVIQEKPLPPDGTHIVSPVGRLESNQKPAKSRFLDFDSLPDTDEDQEKIVFKPGHQPKASPPKKKGGASFRRKGSKK